MHALRDTSPVYKAWQVTRKISNKHKKNPGPGPTDPGNYKGQR